MIGSNGKGMEWMGLYIITGNMQEVLQNVPATVIIEC